MIILGKQAVFTGLELFMGILQLLRSGKEYEKVWPDRKILNNVFREGLVISIIRNSSEILPYVLAVSIIWAYYSGHILSDTFRYIPWIGFFIILANYILIPLTGYRWLGKRAEQQLTGKTLVWYREICEQLEITAELQPTGLSLAKVLKRASTDDSTFKKITEKM